MLPKIARLHPSAVSALGAVGLLLLLWFIYVPALAAIRRSHNEWDELKTEIGRSRRIVDSFRQGSLPSPPPLEMLPAVLENLNALAGSNQIRFLQVIPGNARAGESAEVTILPIELYLEGNYRSIGEFLGSLGQTPSVGGALVRRMSIEREERLLPRLRARLSIELILSGVSDG